MPKTPIYSLYHKLTHLLLDTPTKQTMQKIKTLVLLMFSLSNSCNRNEQSRQRFPF